MARASTAQSMGGQIATLGADTTATDAADGPTAALVEVPRQEPRAAPSELARSAGGGASCGPVEQCKTTGLVQQVQQVRPAVPGRSAVRGGITTRLA